VDEAKLSALRGATAGRIVVVAASTHPGEESAVVNAHCRVKASHPDILTIIAPRHPQRGGEVAKIVAAAGLRPVLRSRGTLPRDDSDVYVFDTVGELGVVYRIASIVFMGGSLVPHGGQNPIEAIKFGAAVLHGPHVSNFADTYAELGRDGGAAPVNDAGSLAAQIAAWIGDGAARDAVAERGRQYVDRFSGALGRTLFARETYFAPLRTAAGRDGASSGNPANA
jgi:3-deoxy-D-manno-octulosonic-acid transferase